jgi:hypothetical protein
VQAERMSCPALTTAPPTLSRTAAAPGSGSFVSGRKGGGTPAAANGIEYCVLGPLQELKDAVFSVSMRFDVKAALCEFYCKEHDTTKKPRTMGCQPLTFALEEPGAVVGGAGALVYKTRSADGKLLVVRLAPPKAAA